MAEISELVKILDRQRAMIEELGAMARAFNYCYESFSEKWEELVQEGQEMITEYESGEADTSNIKEKMSENFAKTKLMREIVCFMSVTLEKYRKGDDKCSE